MSDDDDLASLLPEAPPRPDRREAAIAEALRRFDGGAALPPAKRPIRWLLPSWPKLGRAQMGAIMSMALVAVIGVPIALVALREERSQQLSRDVPARAEPRPFAPGPSVPDAGAPKAKVAPESMLAQAQPLRAPPPPAPDAARSGGAADSVAQESDRFARAEPAASPAQMPRSAATAPAAPPAPAASPPAPSAEQSGALVLTGSRIARRDFTANSPTALAKAVRNEDRGSAEIVVTGSRIMSPAEIARARRGDWNACTVDDPAHRLDGCKRLVDPAAKGNAGRAAARVADGLTLAWDGDMDGAIAAFGAAIDIEPRLAIAYLNRGLAYQRNDDSARALADFDKAVRYAPLAARGYFHRSLALRLKGDARRAAADESRAIELDSRYEALFD